MPRIGLMSDSHGHVWATQRGAQILAEQNPDLLLHMGDIGTTEVLDAMLVLSPATGKPIPCRVVFGNSDWDTSDLRTHADRQGIAVDDPAGTITLGDLELVYTHGHIAQIVGDALARQVAYLCHGHTHKRLDTCRGSTRIINPGALYRASQYTVALLDTDSDQLQFQEVHR